jgi:hypothetical protein
MDNETLTLVIASLLAGSELLAIIPGLKSNSVFQLIFFIIKAIAKAIKEKEV